MGGSNQKIVVPWVECIQSLAIGNVRRVCNVENAANLIMNIGCLITSPVSLLMKKEESFILIIIDWPLLTIYRHRPNGHFLPHIG